MPSNMTESLSTPAAARWPFTRVNISRALAVLLLLPMLGSGTATAERVRIGVSAPLSGVQASSGNDVVSHLRAAVGELNEKGEFGTHQVDLVVVDDAYDPARTRSNVNTLLRDHGVQLLMAQIGSANIAAALEAARGTGVTLYAPLAGPSALYDDAMRPAVVTLRASYADEVRQQERQLKAMGRTRIAVVYQEDAYGQDILAAWRQVRSDQIQLVSEQAVRRGEPNPLQAVDAAMATQPDAVVLALVASPAKVAAQRIRTSSTGAVIPVLMSAAITSEVITELTSPGRGIVLFSSVVPLPGGASSGSPLLLREYSAFRERHRLKPSVRGLEAYVAVRALAMQLRRMRVVSPQALGSALAATPSFTVADLTLRTREPRYSDVFAIARVGVL